MAPASMTSCRNWRPDSVTTKNLETRGIWVSTQPRTGEPLPAPSAPYSQKLKDLRWQTKRARILAPFNSKCEECSSNSGLEEQGDSGFASSFLRDQHAVEAALTLPWSNGPVEGRVHRLKLIKPADVRTCQLRSVTPPCSPSGLIGRCSERDARSLRRFTKSAPEPD
jgi:hypothetical protein